LRRWLDPLLRRLGPLPVSAGVVALLCMTLIVINLRHASESRIDAIADARANLQSVAQSVAAHASAAFTVADTVAHDVVVQFETFGTGTEQMRQLQESAAKRARELMLVSNVIALDAHANPVFRLYSAGRSTPRLVARDFFEYHRTHAERGTHVSHPVQAFSDGRWVVPVSRRFDNADGSFGGVVVVLIDRRYFDRFHYSLGVGRTVTIALHYADDGSLLSSNTGLPGEAANRASAANLLAPAVARSLARAAVPTSGSALRGSDGVERIYGTAPVAGYGQAAIVTQSTASALKSWEAANRVAAQSATLTTVLCAVLVLVLAFQVRSRRAVEADMVERENQSRLMIDGLEDYGIYMLDTAGKVITWNAGAQRVTGFTASEAIGSYGDFFCMPEDRGNGRVERILQHAKLFGREENEGWRVRRDGTRFWVHAITRPLYDQLGMHYGYLKVLRDITLARQNDEALQASEFRWKYALEGAGEGVWDIDYLTGVAEVSDRYLDMLGFDRSVAPIKFKTWRDWVHPDDLPAAMKAFTDHCNGVTPNYLAEYRTQCKDGSWKWVLSRGMVVSRDAQGKPQRIIGTHSDISHVKLAEEQLNYQNMLVMEKNVQLEQASRVKSEFLANMSHELRTPLNAVLGFTGTILMELPGPLNAEQKKQLEIVRDSGRHLLALINEILDLSKIEAGNAEVRLKTVCCQELLADVTRTLMPLASQKHIALEVVAPDVTIDILTDARLLKQILINLIGNAVKFTESGTVTVELQQRPQAAGGTVGADAPAAPDAVWIDVADTGIGIREEDLGKLFLPFTQIEAALSRRFEGTGLGLNVSKKYAELLGATLHVRSRYGQGSTFSVCLPATSVVAA
jgi:two-component system sensor histidine kinase/response regulator